LAWPTKILTSLKVDRRNRGVVGRSGSLRISKA
jgi:hypothetical protein